MAITTAWDTRFEVGHERIDSEHRVFLSLVRDLSAMTEEGASTERMKRMLQEISKYADFHFISEENLMIDIGYPCLTKHRQEHGMLLAQLQDKIYSLQFDWQTPEEIVSFLFQWFALHTTQEDKKICEFIQKSKIPR